ncbi:hypothetical protein [Flocculibacter collagenilyticus]|uniref:hypothetical protein n=1 Tax=Flocculibacter collagenilyticus TaxID=2744479 RepID=UPI0018F2EC8D|nr:hypothetical protein [Flocculibacter collagenilyticus]
MLIAVLVIILIIFITLLTLNVIAKNKEKQKIAEHKANLSRQVGEIRREYKTLLVQLVKTNIIDRHDEGKLYAIANNYFVFQPINEVNIKKFKQCIDSILIAFGLTSNVESLVQDQATMEVTKPLLVGFALKLPMGARNFTASFYNETLPRLVFDYSDIVANRLLRFNSSNPNDEYSHLSRSDGTVDASLPVDEKTEQIPELQFDETTGAAAPNTVGKKAVTAASSNSVTKPKPVKKRAVSSKGTNTGKASNANKATSAKVDP